MEHKSLLKVIQQFCIVLIVIVATLILITEYFVIEDKVPVPRDRKYSSLPSDFNEINLRQKILCFVVTCPQNHYIRAIHVKNTWGRRCDKLLFMSTLEDPELGAVKLPNVGEGRDWLWGKTKASLEHVWRYYRDEYDWFMKADDDTFVVVENLRALLEHYNTSDPVYFGYQMSTPPEPSYAYVEQGYNHGGSGYVLGREALDRFVNRDQYENIHCSKNNDGGEDWSLGQCMEELGVQAVDTRDSRGLHRFLPYHLDWYVVPGNMPESHKNLSWYEPHPTGKNCCSPEVVSFHYVKPEVMYIFEYLIYSVRPHDEQS